MWLFWRYLGSPAVYSNLFCGLESKCNLMHSVGVVWLVCHAFTSVHVLAYLDTSGVDQVVLQLQRHQFYFPFQCHCGSNNLCCSSDNCSSARDFNIVILDLIFRSRRKPRRKT